MAKFATEREKENDCAAFLAQELLTMVRKALMAGATTEVLSDGHGYSFVYSGVDGCKDLRVIVTSA